jgi:quinol monooxygenase YgiN
MAAPIVFVSHFHVRAGHLDTLRRLTREVVTALDRDKPKTLAYLAYLDAAELDMTIVHVFGDADAMDLHFEGAAERSQAAYQLMQPRGWEIYGTPSERVLDTIRSAAETAGVRLTLQPASAGGFLRLASSATDR